MTFFQFIKFGMVGSTGLAIDFGFTWLFKEKFKFNKYLANAIGFGLGTINNYFLNKYFTFEDTNQNIGSQLLRFCLISMIGFGLNTGMIYFLQRNTRVNFYVSKAIVTILVFFWNFFANSIYTFS